VVADLAVVKLGSHRAEAVPVVVKAGSHRVEAVLVAVVVADFHQVVPVMVEREVVASSQGETVPVDPTAALRPGAAVRWEDRMAHLLVVAVRWEDRMANLPVVAVRWEDRTADLPEVVDRWVAKDPLAMGKMAFYLSISRPGLNDDKTA
jgi:hypothetical protein